MSPICRRRRNLGIVISLCAAAAPLIAQTPSPSVSTGFGVDTTAADVGNIVALVRAYLAAPDTSARSRGLWTTATDFDRRIGDLTAGQAYQGFPAIVVGVIAVPSNDSLYVVKILHARADSAEGIAPLALQRVFAIRDTSSRFRFKLGSALPYVTKDWERRNKGPITFIYAPAQRPNQQRIDSAVRFVDSVARTFRVSSPEHLDVIVGPTMDEVERAIGMDFFVEPSGPGVRSGGRNFGSVLLVGNPMIGEAYYHEFVHAVLGPHIRAGTQLLAEGVATWMGGSRGRTPLEMYGAVHRYQLEDSTLTLSGLFRKGFNDPDALRASDLLYGTGALIAKAVYEKRGIAGVRTLYETSGDADAILRAIARSLDLPVDESAALDRWWRTEAARSSSRRTSR